MTKANATDGKDRKDGFDEVELPVGMKILLADDHIAYRDLVAQALRKAHENVTLIEASNFDEALLLAKAHDDLTLAIVDLIMPGMDGFAGIAALRERLPEVPIVVVSALSKPRHILQAYDHGADGFIPKSPNTKLLLSALGVVLSGGVYIPPEALGAVGKPLEAAMRAAKLGFFRPRRSGH